MKGRIYPGDWLLALLVLAPLLLALPGVLAGLAWSWTALTSSLAVMAGILALSTFLVAAMLSARIPGLDVRFGGQVRLWYLHRLLGTTAFMLVMLHVVLLALSALPLSVAHSVTLLFPPLQQWEIWAGWVAFVVMVLFIAPTLGFFISLHYQFWKRVHMLSAPAMVLAVAHVLVLTPTPGIWWFLSTLAVAAIVWRRGLSPFLARKAYRVENVDQLTRDVVELSLLPVGKGITWGVGQFVYLTPMEPSLDAGYREEHPYTIASSSRDDSLRIGIKGIGDATEALLSIKPGAEVRVEGPYGDFFEVRAPGRKQLWIGGGIGITPFVSGAREFQSAGPKTRPATLFYLANRPERAYYLDELQRIAEACGAFTVQPHYFHEEGALTRDYLAAHCPDFALREVYLCGPPGMIHHVTELLKQEGVPRHHIHTEVFDFL